MRPTVGPKAAALSAHRHAHTGATNMLLRLLCIGTFAYVTAPSESLAAFTPGFPLPYEQVNVLTGEDHLFPDVALDPAGNAYAVWFVEHSRTSYDVLFSFRPLNGAWQTPEIVNEKVLGRANQYDVSIAVDNAGNAYVLWVDDRHGVDQIFFSMRTAAGVWSPNTQVSEGEGIWPNIAVDHQGNAYAVWDHNWDDVFFAYLPAGGSWGANERVNDDTTNLQYWASIVVDASGNAYAAWTDYRNGSANAYSSYRPHNGAWQPNEQINDVDDSVDEMSPMSLAIDGSGNLYAAWEDDRLGGVTDQMHVYTSYRPAGGNWGANERVDTEPTEAHLDGADIVVDRAGNAVAFWTHYDPPVNSSMPSAIHFSVRPVGGSWGAGAPVSEVSNCQWHPNATINEQGKIAVVWINCDVNVDAVSYVATTPEVVTPIGCLHASASLDLRDRTLVSVKDVYSGGYFELGADARVTGDVAVDGSAFMRSRAYVDGDVTLAGGLTTQTGTVITGTLAEYADVTIPEIPTHAFSHGSADVTINNNKTATINPGDYRDVMIRARATVRFYPGVYNVRTLWIEPDAKVILNAQDGAIRFNVAEHVEFGDRAKITKKGTEGTVFYTNGSGMARVGTDVKLPSGIVAPYGQVHVYSRSLIEGCIAAKDITIEPDSVLH